VTFAFPYVLLLLPLVLPLLRKPRVRAITVTSLAGWQGTGEPRRVKWLKALRVLRAMAAAVLIVAMAGPRTERPVTEEIRQGIAIEMLVDISSSMDISIAATQSGRATRMEAAKEAVKGFIENRPDDLIGLITFARYADTLSPLTFGHSALIQLVEELEIQDLPNEDGTAYGDALAAACAQLDRMNAWKEDDDDIARVQSKIVILLTDGENNCGLHLPQEAAGLAKEWDIRVYTVSLGDCESDVELTDSEKLLDIISEGTGGTFWKIHDREELDEAYAAIDRLEKSEIRSATLSRTEYTHVMWWFALPALLMLLLDVLLGATLLRVTGEES
jgi:Ca-activated chloride channel family protein